MPQMTNTARQPSVLPSRWEVLFSAVLSDALDAVGYTRQAMPPRIRPLDDRLRLCARARTGLYVEDNGATDGVNPYELEIAIVDDLRANEVVVFACGGSEKIAPWGSLLSTAAQARGAAGCVTDGFVRDILSIREMEMPVFHGGIAPLDSKGRGHVSAIDIPIICAGVKVCPGDLVFGDADGVVVIPQEIESEVLRIAIEKVDGENNTMNELRQGAYLRDVYAKYGVL